ncbi:MAG: kynurenine formamidase, partial [Candidatus Eisenbacteria bacterium]|nr:kynurenine formamidase [Candidatus Latescibacterota bacterium]MBD3303396.1 kynurenine formamidase [Candidatus Eisenbacteria bacterium]
THADAPLHVRDGAPGIEAADLAAYLGPACVVEAAPDERGLLPESILDAVDPSDPPRILFKTGTDPDPKRWTDRFAALSLDLARRLAAGGARLVGLDTPSVDPADSKDLPAHRILLDAGMAWLENLDLSGVEPGRYTLVALPLRIRGADASPVRAILID